MRLREGTNKSLFNSIWDYDLENVERILAIRDENGVPVELARIATQPHSAAFNPINQVLITIRHSKNPEDQSEIAYQILQRLLAVRDNLGNPVCDINNPFCHHGGNSTIGGETILTSLLMAYESQNITAVRLRMLFDTILNLRYNDGSRVYRFERDNSYPGLLGRAILINDIALVSTILDLRNEDGDYAIDVNQVITHPVNGRTCTPLDVAYETNPPIDGDIIQLLLARGARSRNNRGPRPQAQGINQPVQFRRVVHQQARPPEHLVARPALPAPAPAPNPNAPRPAPAPAQAQAPLAQQAAAFNAASQNVHNTEVERTVDNSIVRLKEKYKTPTPRQVDTTLAEIENFINACKRKKYKTDRSAVELDRVLAEISYVKSVIYSKHNLSNLDLKQVLTLVWLAASDETAIPSDNTGINPSILVMNRKLAVIDALFDNASTYPGRDIGERSCIGGYRNRIIDSLNKAHPCVTIISTGAELFDYAVEFSKREELKYLKDKPLAMQKAIFRDWPLMAEASVNGTAVDKDNQAFQFLKEIQPRMKDALVGTQPRGAFTDLLQIAQLNNIVGDTVFFQRPLPAIHPALVDLLTKIEGIYIPAGSSPTTTVKTRLSDELKEFAKETLKSERSFEEDFQSLKQEYAHKWGCWETLNDFKTNIKPKIPADKTALFDVFLGELNPIEQEGFKLLAAQEAQPRDCGAVFAPLLIRLMDTQSYSVLQSDKIFKGAFNKLLGAFIPHQKLAELLLKIFSPKVEDNFYPMIKEGVMKIFLGELDNEQKYQKIEEYYNENWGCLENAGNFCLIPDNSILLKAFDIEGFNVATGEAISADGKTAKIKIVPFYFILLSFLGLPNRPDTIEYGVPKLTFMQFLRNLMGGIKIIAAPFKLMINFLKLVTEVLLPFVAFYISQLTARMISGTTTLYNLMLPETLQDAYNPLRGFLFFPLLVMALLTGLTKIIQLTVQGFCLLGTAFTSPEKSARLAYSVLGWAGVVVSVIVSTLLWGLTLPLAFTAVTSIFPSLMTLFKSIAFLNNAISFLSNSIISSIGPIVSFLTNIIGVSIPTTVMSIGISLGVILTPLVILISHCADQFSNFWFKRNELRSSEISESLKKNSKGAAVLTLQVSKEVQLLQLQQVALGAEAKKAAQCEHRTDLSTLRVSASSKLDGAVELANLAPANNLVG